MMYMVAIRAAMPMTPRATPTPMPMAALAGKPDEASPDPPPAAPLSANPAVGVVTVGLVAVIRVDDEVAVELAVEEAVEEAVDNVISVRIAIFHPTTAMAPTEERLLSVVVAMVHASDSPSGVDANVSTAPEVTSDRQSPRM
jgi:hypothetical protein